MQDEAANKVQITTDFIVNALAINQAAREELTLIDQLSFNIFKVQEMTLQNELVTVTSYILAKQSIFSKMNIPYDIFLTFMATIQKGYRAVTYHNKTHAADLS